MPDFEERLSAVEREVRELRGKVADTHALAAAVDRDIPAIQRELRVHTQLLNATREDMSDLRAEMRAGFSEMRAGFQVLAQMIERVTPPE